MRASLVCSCSIFSALTFSTTLGSGCSGRVAVVVGVRVVDVRVVKGVGVEIRRRVVIL